MSDGPVEIPETEATGVIRELYEDIKVTMNIGMINLIYRRMASVDGVLEWFWHAVRPVLVSGEVDRALSSLTSDLDWRIVPEAPASSLSSLDLGDREVENLIRVVEDYNRGNSLNLLLLTAVGERLRSGGPIVGVLSAAKKDPLVKPLDLPSIVPMSDMSQETASLVRALSAPISPAHQPLIPSLFRHLARWPGFLAVVSPYLADMISSGELSRMSNILQGYAADWATGVSRKIQMPVNATTPDEAVQKFWLDEWQAYTSKPIPEMIVVGHSLRPYLATISSGV